MSDEEKLLWLFNQVHGELSSSCYTEVYVDEDLNPAGVSVMKHGNLCWSVNKVDLLIDYVTKDL